jgi:hypothetical protein
MRFAVILAIATVASMAIAQTTHKPSGDIMREGNVSARPAPQPVTPAVAAPQPEETVAVAEPANSPAPAPDTTPTLATRPADANILLPVGTAIRMKLNAAISTHDSKPGDAFTGKVSEDVVVEGKTIIPVGAVLSGRVQRLFEPRRIAGRPAMQLLPETVTMADGKTLPIAAVIVDTGNPKRLHVNDEGRIKGPGFTQQDKVEMVAGTAVGTIAGTIFKLGKGTWMGAAAGLAFTGGHWLIKRHSLELPEGTELIMEISNPVAAPTTAQPAVAQGGN